MKWILCIGAVLLVIGLGWLPFKGTDVATLEPAEILYVSFDGEVLVETEAGWYGQGKTMDEAIFNLKTTSPEQVFLQTVDYLLLQEEGKERLPEIFPYLRSGCMLCLVEEKPDLEKAGTYLRTHKPDFTLRDAKMGSMDFPRLTMEEGRAYIEK